MTPLLPIAYEFYALAFRNKTVREATQAYLLTYIDLLAPLIQRGIDQRILRAVDTEETAISIASLIEGTLLLWVFDPDKVDLERQLNQSMSVFWAGLKMD